jgi:hypothetical protein
MVRVTAMRLVLTLLVYINRYVVPYQPITVVLSINLSLYLPQRSSA